MKAPSRPFVVEIKRRGKKLADGVRPSIWPDPSIFRAPDDASAQQASSPDSANPPALPETRSKADDKPGGVARILPTLTTDDPAIMTADPSSARRPARKRQSNPSQSKAQKPDSIETAASAVEASDRPVAVSATTVDAPKSDDQEPARSNSDSRKSRRKRDTATLPRGERWKRRLPKSLR